MDANKIGFGSSARRFLIGPAWRWRQTLELYPDGVKLPPWTDRLVVEAVTYLRATRPLLDTGYHDVDGEPVGIAVAISREIEISRNLEVLVIGRVSEIEIVKDFGIDSDWLRTWCMLFFDLANLRTASGWICQHVLDPAKHAGDAEHAERLRLAWAGGPYAAKALVSLPVDIELSTASEPKSAIKKPSTKSRPSPRPK